MPKPNPDKSKPRSLVERYVVPPFSVLDAKQGYWQQRKRAWLELGVDDGSSRIELKGTGSFSGTDPRYYDTKNEIEQRIGRKLSHAEFVADYYQPHEGSNLRASTSGAIVSLFDPVLCEIAYRWFCPPGGQVIDPFAGGGVRGIVAAALGRQYVGVDLSRDQVRTNRGQWSKMTSQQRRNWPKPRWRQGDARSAIKLARGEYDFIFTCPPYYDLERYTDDKRDLSAMKPEDFLLAYRQVIAATTAMLKPDRFACIVVGDVRDRDGFYRNFVSQTIGAFEGAGLRLYNEAILATMLGSLPLRVARQFDVARKLGKAHQNVLVFVKGDPAAAARAVGPVTLPDDPRTIATTGRRRRHPKLASPVHVYPARRAVA